MCKGTVRDVMNNMFLSYTSLTTHITTLHIQKFERILFFLKLQLQETLNVMSILFFVDAHTLSRMLK